MSNEAESVATLVEAFPGRPELVVEIAVLLAQADGEIDEAESSALVETLQAAFGASLAPMVVRALIEEVVDLVTAEGAEARAKALAAQLAEAGALDQGVQLAQAIAESSEGVGEEEAKLIALLRGAA
jgi:tellurite resistance protein